MAHTIRRYACLPDDEIREGAFTLVTVQDAHVEPIRCWRNAQMNVLRQSAPIGPEQQAAYFASQIWPTLDEPQPRTLLLSLLRDGHLVGYGGLVHIAWEHRRAELSFLLDPAVAADRVTYAAHFTIFLTLLQRLAFTNLGVHRLFTETYAVREAHISVLESAGFRREGRLRHHVRIEGEPIDSLIHGRIASDPR